MLHLLPWYAMNCHGLPPLTAVCVVTWLHAGQAQGHSLLCVWCHGSMPARHRATHCCVCGDMAPCLPGTGPLVAGGLWVLVYSCVMEKVKCDWPVP